MRDAALLARPAYRYVAGDGGNSWEAAAAVLVAVMGFGVATFLGWWAAGSPVAGLLAGLVFEPLVTLAAWLGGSVTAWLVGVRLAPGNTSTTRFWPVARALAFAQTPNLVGVLVVLPPPYRSGVWLMARLWVLAASSTAIRESLGLSGGRLLVTLLVSAAVYAALLIGIFAALVSLGVGRAASVHGVGGL